MRFYVLAAAAALLVIGCGEAPQAQPGDFGVHQAALAAPPAATAAPTVAVQAPVVPQPAAEAQGAVADPKQAAADAITGSTEAPAQQVLSGRCGRPGVPPALCPPP